MTARLLTAACAIFCAAHAQAAQDGEFWRTAQNAPMPQTAIEERLARDPGFLPDIGSYAAGGHDPALRTAAAKIFILKSAPDTQTLAPALASLAKSSIPELVEPSELVRYCQIAASKGADVWPCAMAILDAGSFRYKLSGIGQAVGKDYALASVLLSRPEPEWAAKLGDYALSHPRKAADAAPALSYAASVRCDYVLRLLLDSPETSRDAKFKIQALLSQANAMENSAQDSKIIAAAFARLGWDPALAGDEIALRALRMRQMRSLAASSLLNLEPASLLVRAAARARWDSPPPR